MMLSETGTIPNITWHLTATPSYMIAELIAPPHPGFTLLGTHTTAGQ